MRVALEELGSKFIRYTVVVRRSMFSAEFAETEAMNLILFDEPLVQNGGIDRRILRGKSVTLVASVRDGGTAIVNLSTRRVQPIFPSPDLKAAVDGFHSRLIEGARSRWMTGSAIAALLLLPPAGLVGLVLADQAVNPRVAKAFDASGNTSGSIPFDHWVGKAALPISILWIFGIVAAIAIGTIRRWGAPLGIWPEQITAKSFAVTIYRLRVSGESRKNVSKVIIGVIIGVLIAVVSRLL